MCYGSARPAQRFQRTPIRYPMNIHTIQPVQPGHKQKKPREAVCQAGADSRQVRRKNSTVTQAFPGALYFEPGSFNHSAR